MVLLYPEINDTRISVSGFRGKFNKSLEQLQKDLMRVDYSQVTSKEYRFVLKRKDLWDVENEVYRMKGGAKIFY